jgi:hypothetical protein
LIHAGKPFDCFKTISNPSVQVTFAGFCPSLICLRGGGKYAIDEVIVVGTSEHNLSPQTLSDITSHAGVPAALSAYTVENELIPIEKTRKSENSKRNFIIIYRNFLTKTKFKGSCR